MKDVIFSIPLKLQLVVVLSFCCVSTFAQEYNQMDNEGNRHGVWKKKYLNSDQIRYTGTFEHGKEVGVFTFYDKAGGKPTALKEYKAGSSLLEVSFYTTAGKKVSEGTMNDRLREGDWTYYHSDGKTILSTETYKNDVLEGKRTTYFRNGQKALEENYIQGKKEGIALHYTDEGKTLKELTYKNDALEGPSKLYNGLGILVKEGNYKANKKNGVWKYYENGKLLREVKFPQNKIGVEH